LVLLPLIEKNDIIEKCENMDILYVTIALLGVLGLMFLTFFGIRMLNRRISTSGGRLRVIDRATLGRDSMLLVVSVCGKLMLVGVSSQRIEKLSDLDITEEEYVEKAFSDAGKFKTLPFSDILSSFINKREDKDKDDEDSEEQEIQREIDINELIIELVNPEIVTEDGEQTGSEGCLSIPGVYGMVTRPETVVVRAQDRNGEAFEIAVSELTARAVCHEVDHLNGVLFTSLAEKILTEEELAELKAQRETHDTEEIV